MPNCCRFRDLICHKCQKKEHNAKMCKSGRPPNGNQSQKGEKSVGVVEETPASSKDEIDKELIMFQVTSKPQCPIVVIMGVNGQQVPMELDTGAAVSVISSATRERLFPNCQVTKTLSILTTYMGEPMPVEGEMKVCMDYGEQRAELSLYAVKGAGPSLLGREWLRQIRLDWQSTGLA